MNKKTHCDFCGQRLPEMRLGIRLTPLKACIYDVIHRTGQEGISNAEIRSIVYNGEPRGRQTVKAHIWQINDLLDDTDFVIRYDHNANVWKLKRRKDATIRTAE